MPVLKMIKCPTCIGIGDCSKDEKCPTCGGSGEVRSTEVITEEPCQPVIGAEAARR